MRDHNGWLGQELTVHLTEFLNDVYDKYHCSRKEIKLEWCNNMKSKQNETGIDQDKEHLQNQLFKPTC